MALRRSVRAARIWAVAAGTVVTVVLGTAAATAAPSPAAAAHAAHHGTRTHHSSGTHRLHSGAPARHRRATARANARARRQDRFAQRQQSALTMSKTGRLVHVTTLTTRATVRPHVKHRTRPAAKAPTKRDKRINTRNERRARRTLRKAAQQRRAAHHRKVVRHRAQQHNRKASRRGASHPAGIAHPATATTGTISGNITDAGTGTGIANYCTIDAIDGDGNEYAAASCSASGTGHYVVSGLPAGSYVVYFGDTSLGYLPTYYGGDTAETATEVAVSAGQTVTNINVALEEGGSITGTLTDAATGNPLADVCGVRVYSYDTGTEDDGLCTDDSGVYTAGGLQTGSYYVQATVDGYISAYYGGSDESSAQQVDVTAGATQSGTDIALQQAGAVTGVVTDATTNQPLADDCNVYVEVDDAATQNYIASSSDCTDDTGRYTVNGLPSGRYVVYVYDRSEGYLNQWYDGAASYDQATPVQVTAGTTVPGIDFHLATGGTMAGTLTDAASGDPLANNCNVDVYATAASDGQQYYLNDCTDANGGYVIRGLPTGQYTVSVDDAADNYLAQTSAAKSVVAGGSAARADFALQHGAQLTGVVKDDATGQPVDDPDCEISISVYAADDPNDAVGYASCLQNGAFTVGGLASGSYKVDVQYYGLPYLNEWYDGAASFNSATPVTLTAPNATSIDVTAHHAGSIAGAVTDASSGNPATDVCVNAFAASDLYDSVGSGCTNDSGAYEIDGLPTGNYVVEFDGRNTSEHYITQYYNGQSDGSTADLVSVTAGVTTPNIDAAMVAGGWISGQITDSNGNPVPDVCLELYVVTDGGDNYADVPEACSDESGRYETEGLAQGRYKLFTDLYDSPYVAQWYDGVTDENAATPVDVTIGQNTDGIDFSLSSGESISGTVTGDDTGSGLSDVQVCASNVDTGNEQCGYSDDTGFYTVGGLTDGRYQIRFLPAEGQYVGEWYDDQTSSDNATLVTVNGSDVTGVDAGLAPGGTVTGAITDASTGDPVAACVDAYADNGDYFGESCTDNGQNYSITLPNGTYSLQLYGYMSGSQGFPYLTQTKDSVPVTVGNVITEDFALTRGATVSGTVTDASNEAPLAGVCVSLENDNYYSDEVCTDQSGQYSSVGVPADTYVVVFDNYQGRYITQYYDGAASYDTATPVTLGAGESKTGIDAAMVLGGVVGGTVTDAATGQPVADVCITLEKSNGDFAGDGGCTDDSGHYLSAAVASGDYVVNFSDSDGRYAPQWYDNSTTLAGASLVHVSVGSTTHGIDAAMQPNDITISGTVTEQSGGAAVSGACAYLYHLNGTYAGLGACAADDGYYSIDQVPAGEYDVAIFDPSGMHQTEWYGQSTTQSGATSVDVSSGSADGVDVQVARVTSVAGAVTDSKTGQPVSGVCAYLYHSNGSYAGHGSCTTGNGHYAIQGESAGTYDVAFTDPGGTHLTQWYAGATSQATATPVTVTDGAITSGIDATIAPITAIVGTVTDRQTGDPISGACAYLYHSGGAYAGVGYCTNASGRYVLANMPAGSYQVAVFDPAATHSTGWFPTGGVRSTATDVTVTDGQISTGNDLALDESGSVTGLVQDGSGNARNDVCVYADDSTGAYSGVGGCTDGTGRYTLAGLRPGSYKLGFYPPGMSSPTSIWYLNASSEATATAVSVGGGQTTHLTTEAIPAG